MLLLLEWICLVWKVLREKRNDEDEEQSRRNSLGIQIPLHVIVQICIRCDIRRVIMDHLDSHKEWQTWPEVVQLGARNE